MATHTKHQQSETVYFVTFTCYEWLPLFEESNAYETVYRWFSHIKEDAKILGDVIMPNHVHLLIYVESEKRNLNQIISAGKRFLAYDLVQSLKRQHNQSLLQVLRNGVSPNERAKGKQHQVFRLSFDAKVCVSRVAIEKALDYTHANPVTKKWHLVNDMATYKHSSASFYLLGKSVPFPLTHYMDVL